MQVIRRSSVLVAVALASAWLLLEHSAIAEGDTGSPRTTVKWAKLSSDLGQVVRAQRTSRRGLATARAAGLRVVGDRIRVVVEARSSRAAAVSAVLATGGKVEAQHASLVQALVGPGALARLADSSAVAYVRAPRTPAADGPVATG